MSTATLTPPTAPTPATPAARAAARGRLGVTIVLIVALLGAALTRNWAQNLRYSALTTGGQALMQGSTSSSLSSMNSYALALLLGGLRGPLVMILWSSSESQKADKDLEDFDTKVEWIRLLQPEFDSVHIFQIWNKAYNVSVQMASLANKYTAILDSLDYAERIDAQRPNNINICLAVADVWFNKLGLSSEKEYYRKRVRDETKWREQKAGLKKGDIGWQHTRLDPMLDKDGNILPELLKPKYARPAHIKEGQRYNDGADLQFLKQYQPFPYGISPLALGFNYYQRGQVLEKVYGQHHLQISSSVVDSRPALCLRFWGEEEWERARRLELTALGLPQTSNDPDHRLDLELASAGAPLNAALPGKQSIPEALYSYSMAARLLSDAAAEYTRHLREEDFKANVFTYQSHLDHVNAVQKMMIGDGEYLNAMSLPAGERGPHLKAAADAYRQSIRGFRQVMLKFYTDASMIERLKFNKAALELLTDEQLAQGFDYMHAQMAGGTAGIDPNREDRQEYEAYVQRASTRLKQIDSSSAK